MTQDSVTGVEGLRLAGSERYPLGAPRMEFVYPGNPAFTLVTHTLTDAGRERLREALQPHVKGGAKKDKEALGAIIERLMPPAIMQELQEIKQQPDLPKLVMIRNLPEVAEQDISRTKADIAGQCGEDIRKSKESWQAWITAHSYASCINQGLFEALEMQSGAQFKPIRYFNENEDIPSTRLHRDQMEMTALAVVMTDAAPTAFVDWPAVLAEAIGQGLGGAKLILNAGKTEGTATSFDTLMAMDKAKPVNYNNMHGVDRHESPETVAKIEAIIAKHSHQLVIGPGDVVVGSNKSRILHRGLLGPEQAGEGVRRLACVNFAKQR